MKTKKLIKVLEQHNQKPERRTKIRIQLQPQDYHQRKECEHTYKCTYEGYEGETYECTKCRDRYKLYYEDMA